MQTCRKFLAMALCFCLSAGVVEAQGGPGGGRQGGGPGGRQGGPGGGGRGPGGGGGGQGFGFQGGQGPGGQGLGGPGGGGDGQGCQGMVSKMMSMDTNQDGNLSGDEVRDPRLHAMMNVADTDADGLVSQSELTAMFNQQMAEGGPMSGGPGGRGRGPGGPKSGSPGERSSSTGGDRIGSGGGPGMGRGGPPQPGEILPSFMVDDLEMTDQQKTQLAELQKAVDKKLQSILNKTQRQKLKELRGRGPGGHPDPGGSPPSGGPPDGQDSSKP